MFAPATTTVRFSRLLGVLGVLLCAPEARAEVLVTDPSGCVDSERLALDLALLLGEDVASAIVLQVEVDGRSPTGLEVRMAVHEHDLLRWERALEATPADCPVLHGAIALSVQQGLEAMGGWQAAPPRPSTTVRLGLSLAKDPRGRLGVERSYPLGSSLGAAAGLCAELGGPVRVGSGRAVLGGVLACAALEHTGRLRPSISLAIGPTWARGSGFPSDHSAQSWRGTAGARLSFPLGAGTVDAGVEGAWMRIALLDESVGIARVEPPLRLVIGTHLDRRE